VAAAYDWSVVARRILEVYETVVAGAGEVTAEDEDEELPDLAVPSASRRLIRSRGGHR
jgi:phosphatidylinositol alpha-mannosyltransferase